MANVRDSDTSLWLHNKLGTSNDSWTSGSICSQLNKEVLRNIKDCFPDLQTQVKLKLLLSFFHIPRRLIEEWKSELEEIIDTAAIDSELWVSMLAETMKTLPASGSLNTEISDYEENRPIFTDMVNDLKKLLNKHSDIGMLPLECQYLNKAALTSVVGQQPAPVKHFTLKRKPKSTALRAELLLKSSDAQSSLKKVSAPTIPLRSRGMPRKMTDTTPLKGIPSRVPTSGFRSPPTLTPNRPNFSRIPAGRKEGGVKLLDIAEQPLGYAAAKKRKRQQELEEQQKKTLENQNNNNSPTSTATTPVSASTTTPDYAAGLSATSVYTQPPTPAATLPMASATVKNERAPSPPASMIATPALASTILTSSTATISQMSNALSSTVPEVEDASLPSPPVSSPVKIQSIPITSSVALPTIIKQEPLIIKSEPITVASALAVAASTPSSLSTSSTSTNNVQKVILSQSSIQNIISSSMAPSTMATATIAASTATIIKKEQKIFIGSSGTGNNNITSPQLITQIPTVASLPTSIIKQQQQQLSQHQGTPINFQTIITSSAPTSSSLGTSNIIQIPRQTTIKQIPRPMTSNAGTTIQQIHQIQSPQQKIGTQQKIIYKTAQIVVSSSNNNIPPLIPTGHQTMAGNKIHVQNVQNINIPINRIQLDANSAKTNIIRIAAPGGGGGSVVQNQSGQLQQIVSGTGTATTMQSPANTMTIQGYGQQAQTVQQGQKMQQIVVQSPGGMNMKGKTIILANPNQLTQKGGVIIRQGNQLYQQIPISNFINAGPPGLVKSEPLGQQQQQQQQNKQIPALVPASSIQNIPSLAPVMIQQSSQGIPALLTTTNQNQQQQQQKTTTVVRPMQMANLQSMSVLPQGLTLIHRPGQQPQLVQLSGNQTIQTQPTTIQRTIIRQQAPTQQQGERPQLRQQTIYVPQQTQIQQIQQNNSQQPQQQQQQNNRKGLSLPPKCYMEAHEMFKNANVVTRPDKALILGFMAGYRQNPQPAKDGSNVLVIKLGDAKEQILQENGSYVLTSVESFVKLDFNTGEWKTFKETKILEHHHEESNTASNSVAI